MGPKFDTCFFERYAMISLQTLEGHRYDCLVNEDRPDLQAPDHSIGIEVTRAMEESRDVADSMVMEMAGIPDGPYQDEGPMQEEYRRIMDSGYAYGLYGGKYIGKKEYGYWLLAQPLKRILENKVKKVGSGFYGTFNEFGLYVFCKDQLSENEIRLAMDYTEDLQKDSPVKYRTLFISLIDKLYVCDMNDGTSHWHNISSDQCRRFFINALSER